MKNELAHWNNVERRETKKKINKNAKSEYTRKKAQLDESAYVYNFSMKKKRIKR